MSICVCSTNIFEPAEVPPPNFAQILMGTSEKIPGVHNLQKQDVVMMHPLGLLISITDINNKSFSVSTQLGYAL